MIFMFVSCRPPIEEMPSGVWMSEEPFLMLYIDSDYAHFSDSFASYLFLGFYDRGNQRTKVFLHQRYVIEFGLYPATSMLSSGSLRHGDMLFAGRWELIEDQLILRRHDTRERITLNHIYNYDPIDPRDWFPQLQD